LINVSLLRIFLNTGLTGFPTKKSGPDPNDADYQIPTRGTSKDGEEVDAAERGGCARLNFNILLATNEAKGEFLRYESKHQLVYPPYHLEATSYGLSSIPL
jgi:hypothetical protein